MLVDTHCHLDFERYDEDRHETIQRAIDQGITHVVIPSVDLDRIPAILELADRYPEFLYTAVGVHPNSTASLPEDWLYQLEEFAEHPSVVAVGEIGLDYYWEKVPHHIQHKTFAEQLELAFDLALPVIIHNRDAGADVIKLLKASSLKEVEKPGVLHSFLDTEEIAWQAIEMGYFLGITGPVTYKKNDWLREIVKKMPLDRIVVETDGPFLAPQVVRGKRNEPAYVSDIADYIAELRGISNEIFWGILTENTACLFGGDVIYGEDDFDKDEAE
ncbi:MAG: TatD family hydrolase [Chloroflexota bacterium]